MLVEDHIRLPARPMELPEDPGLARPVGETVHNVCRQWRGIPIIDFRLGELCAVALA